MLDLVLPNTLGREELACAEEVAKELGLKTEKVVRIRATVNQVCNYTDPMTLCLHRSLRYSYF